MSTQLLGYPINYGYDYSALSVTIDQNLNNVGDPFSTSSIRSNTKQIECTVIRFFAQIWNIDPQNMWGYITNSGTEGNLQGLFVGRESAQDRPHVFLTSRDSHFSIFKIAKLLKLNLVLVNSQENGEIDYQDFDQKVRANVANNNYIIVNANLGTTMKGAIDNTQELQRILRKYRAKYYMHADGALSGFYLPFMEHDLFFKAGINSISISGHKFLGIPFPCGIFMMERRFMDLVANTSEYIGSNDYMISCSRSGHSALFFQHIIAAKRVDGFRRDIEKCFEIADYATRCLGDSAWRNHNSIIIVFPKPMDDWIVQKWQLATEGDIAHLCIMPHVTKEMIDMFVLDFYGKTNETLNLGQNLNQYLDETMGPDLDLKYPTKQISMNFEEYIDRDSIRELHKYCL